MNKKCVNNVLLTVSLDTLECIKENLNFFYDLATGIVRNSTQLILSVRERCSDNQVCGNHASGLF